MADYVIETLDGSTVEGRKISVRAAPRKKKMDERGSE